MLRPWDYYDNRHSKRNPKAPDFKHKATGAALWLNSAPAHVQAKLATLDFGLRRQG